VSRANDRGVEPGSLDEVARLLALVLKRDRPMQETIVEMSEVGLGPKRISELVGTSQGYAGVAIDRARKKKKKTGPKTRKGGS
jgi:hypothetical protein